MRKVTNNKDRGPLIKVQLGPHRFAKMYEKDAIEKGLITKAKPQPENKMRALVEDKSPSPPTPPPAGEGRKVPREDWEDFTEIPGIGPASRDALHAHGVCTYEELLIADVSFLTAKAQKAIEALREGLGG